MKDKILKLLWSDKALHLVYSFMITGLLYSVIQLFLPPSTSLGLAAVFTIILGVMKELIDEKFDPMDIGFDIIGVVLYILTELIQKI